MLQSAMLIHQRLEMLKQMLAQRVILNAKRTLVGLSNILLHPLDIRMETIRENTVLKLDDVSVVYIF